jgi:hypothetical protein
MIIADRAVARGLVPSLAALEFKRGRCSSNSHS